MVCPGCSAVVAQDVHFCPNCGAQVRAAQPVYIAYPPPLLPPVPRVQRNLQTLGILWCIFGAYRVVAGLIGMIVLRAVTLRTFGTYGWPFDASAASSWMSSLIPILAVYTVCIAALALLVGFSLLTRRPWGRALAIVVGILTLLKPILGTALGIYTLWVLGPSASGDEYEAIADV